MQKGNGFAGHNRPTFSPLCLSRVRPAVVICNCVEVTLSY